MYIIYQEAKATYAYADWIYEFINLSIPMQRMCTVEEMGGPHCNKEVLAMLKNWMHRTTNHPQTLYGKDWKSLKI